MKQKYNHRTREERCSIEQMRKAGYQQNQIAKLLGRSEGTISRMVRRNIGARGYRLKQADELANQRRFESRKRTQFSLSVQWAIEDYLREDLIPEQVTVIMRRKCEGTVSLGRDFKR